MKLLENLLSFWIHIFSSKKIIDTLYHYHQQTSVLTFVICLTDLNVLLFNGGQLAKLSDWDGSIFVRNEAELTRTSSIERKGTPGFCAMEVRVST